MSKLCDPATLPMVIWMHSTRFFMPDLILQENVVGFDDSILQECLTNPDHSCFCPTLNSVSHSELIYSYNSVKGSPLDLGFPIGGLRKFGSYVSQTVGRFRVKKDGPFLIQYTFNANTDDVLLMPASAFLCASADMLDAMKANHIENCHLVGLDTSHSWFDLIIPSYRRRVIESQALALEYAYGELVNDSAADRPDAKINWNKDMVLTELNQSMTYTNLYTDHVPRLQRGSVCYDLVRKRLLCPEELWLFMGWPVPGLTQYHASKYFPYSFHDQGPATSNAKQFMGNAVHVQCTAR